MHKWFKDPQLGMCRVISFTGFKNKNTKKFEPVLFYNYRNAGAGRFEEECSSLVEVAKWVRACKTNL